MSWTACFLRPVAVLYSKNPFYKSSRVPQFSKNPRSRLSQLISRVCWLESVLVLLDKRCISEYKSWSERCILVVELMVSLAKPELLPITILTLI